MKARQPRTKREARTTSSEGRRRPTRRAKPKASATCDRCIARDREDAAILREAHARQAALRARFDRLHDDYDSALARERDFLGALMLSPLAIRRRAWIFEVDSLISTTNGSVLDAIVAVSFVNRVPVTIDSVCAELERKRMLRIVGGRSYVASLIAPRRSLAAEIRRLARTYGQCAEADPSLTPPPHAGREQASGTGEAEARAGLVRPFPPMRFTARS